ncbi:LOW QUALITY PROTEIN: hypothetical protein V1478_013096, partial [Vespula squamosa]
MQSVEAPVYHFFQPQITVSTTLTGYVYPILLSGSSEKSDYTKPNGKARLRTERKALLLCSLPNDRSVIRQKQRLKPLHLIMQSQNFSTTLIYAQTLISILQLRGYQNLTFPLRDAPTFGLSGTAMYLVANTLTDFHIYFHELNSFYSESYAMLNTKLTYIGLIEILRVIKWNKVRPNLVKRKAALWVKPLRGNTPACLRLLRALFEMVQFTHIRLANTDVRRESLEEYRNTVTLRQSKHSDTRGIYIRERRASRRRRVYHKSRMHNRK